MSETHQTSVKEMVLQLFTRPIYMHVSITEYKATITCLK